MARARLASLGRGLAAWILAAVFIALTEHSLTVYLFNLGPRLAGQTAPTYRHWYGLPYALVVALIVTPFVCGTLTAAISRAARWALLGAVTLWAGNLIALIVFSGVTANGWLPACLVAACGAAIFASGMTGITLFERLPQSHWWRRGSVPWVAGILVVKVTAVANSLWYHSLYAPNVVYQQTLARAYFEDAVLRWGPWVCAGIVVGLVWGKRGVIPVILSVPTVVFGLVGVATDLSMDPRPWGPVKAALATGVAALAGVGIRLLAAPPRSSGLATVGRDTG